MDALIELSDENADWKLSFNEFLNCLKPDFNPPERSKITHTVTLTGTQTDTYIHTIARIHMQHTHSDSPYSFTGSVTPNPTVSISLFLECALEDETYEDGAETQVECNRCVCACGNWVCTAVTCEGESTCISLSCTKLLC